MQLNRKVVVKKQTHEGGKASNISPLKELERTVMSCMLWEDGFYEDGASVADRIKDLVQKVTLDQAEDVAIRARNEMHLRHAPLWVARWIAKFHKKNRLSTVLPLIIQRPDEITEFLSMYWMEGKEPLSAQVKKGLAKCFKKFEEYNFAKYDRDNDVKLRDALFLVHGQTKDCDPITNPQFQLESQPAPGLKKDKYQRGETKRHLGSLAEKIVNRTLEIPDTWETELSAGKDKKATFTRLINEKKLGDLAFLRNLRNMVESGVDTKLIRTSMAERKFGKVFPYRFFSAAKVVPSLAGDLEGKMMSSLWEQEKLPGKTILMVDVSGSMDSQMSGKSEMRNMEAACAIAMLAREICEEVQIVSFSDALVEVPNIHGFGLSDKIIQSQRHSGTYMWTAFADVQRLFKYDRVIIFTDEQAHDNPSAIDTSKKLYIINIATNQNGVAYQDFIHINGFSEKVLDYIREYEKNEEK